MVWGIIGAMTVEVALIKEKMTIIEEKEFFGSTYYKGNVGNKNIALVCCGIGKINATVCAMTLIREFSADCIINIGIAGTLTKNLSVMDIAISKEAVFHDIENLDIYIRSYPYNVYFQADDRLISLAEQAIQQQEIPYKIGRIVTGDDFIENTAIKANIVNRLTPLCVEMEGAAIAQVAYMSKTPFVILRTISDSADDDTAGIYNNFFEVAAHQSANVLLTMLTLSE